MTQSTYLDLNIPTTLHTRNTLDGETKTEEGHGNETVKVNVVTLKRQDSFDMDDSLNLDDLENEYEMQQHFENITSQKALYSDGEEKEEPFALIKGPIISVAHTRKRKYKHKEIKKLVFETELKRMSLKPINMDSISKRSNTYHKMNELWNEEQKLDEIERSKTAKIMENAWDDIHDSKSSDNNGGIDERKHFDELGIKLNETELPNIMDVDNLVLFDEYENPNKLTPVIKEDKAYENENDYVIDIDAIVAAQNEETKQETLDEVKDDIKTGVIDDNKDEHKIENNVEVKDDVKSENDILNEIITETKLETKNEINNDSIVGTPFS